MNRRTKIFVYGTVQGVFFRANAKKKAEELGLNGWVKNKENNSVEILVEGPEDKIKKFTEWCKVGPPNARVDRIEVKKENNRKEILSRFEIRY